ncbi:MAG: AMP-binding protein [Deltaproteobacteria bacterium]|nr:AMP-binding protein [Deltaproteobacteria bacterium]
MMLEDRMYWNMDIEPFLNTPEMKDLQLEKLKVMIKRLYTNAPFFKKRFDEAGINIDNVDRKIKSLEDFSKAIPVYDKAGFREHADACGGDLIRLMQEETACDVDDLVMVNSTTGTTGEPTPYPLTHKDIYDVWGETLCRGLWRGGLRRKDRILYSFALSMVIAGTGTLMGIQKTGAMIIPVGAESGTDRIFQMAKYFKPTVFMGTPSLASYIIEKAPEKIGKEAKELGIKLLACGGEAGAGVPELKKNLEENFGAKLLDIGAGYGASCDYPEYQGMHWLADDLCIYELVDPDTREPIPLEDGARGEGVFTNIEGDGWVWFRTSLGDIHEVTMSPCPCGKTGFRYKIVGRTDDMLKVKGVIVYPAAVTGLLQTFAPKVTGEFRILLTEKPPLVIPPLKIRIERGSDYPADKLGDLEKELLDAFHSRMKIRHEIIWQEPGELDLFHTPF